MFDGGTPPSVGSRSGSDWSGHDDGSIGSGWSEDDAGSIGSGWSEDTEGNTLARARPAAPAADHEPGHEVGDLDLEWDDSAQGALAPAKAYPAAKQPEQHPGQQPRPGRPSATRRKTRRGQDAAARVIQREWKRHSTRRKEAAARAIQREWKRHSTRRKEAAVRTIQRVWRSHHARGEARRDHGGGGGGGSRDPARERGGRARGSPRTTAPRARGPASANSNSDGVGNGCTPPRHGHPPRAPAPPTPPSSPSPSAGATFVASVAAHALLGHRGRALLESGTTLSWLEEDDPDHVVPYQKGKLACLLFRKMAGGARETGGRAARPATQRAAFLAPRAGAVARRDRAAPPRARAGHGHGRRPPLLPRARAGHPEGGAADGKERLQAILLHQSQARGAMTPRERLDARLRAATTPAATDDDDAGDDGPAGSGGKGGGRGGGAAAAAEAARAAGATRANVPARGQRLRASLQGKRAAHPAGAGDPPPPPAPPPTPPVGCTAASGDFVATGAGARAEAGTGPEAGADVGMGMGVSDELVAVATPDVLSLLEQVGAAMESRVAAVDAMVGSSVALAARVGSLGLGLGAAPEQLQPQPQPQLQTRTQRQPPPPPPSSMPLMAVARGAEMAEGAAAGDACVHARACSVADIRGWHKAVLAFANQRPQSAPTPGRAGLPSRATGTGGGGGGGMQRPESAPASRRPRGWAGWGAAAVSRGGGRGSDMERQRQNPYDRFDGLFQGTALPAPSLPLAQQPPAPAPASGGAD